MLDQLSDRADRVAAEAYLPTARRPESVRRLLQYIGYDAVRAALAAGDIRPDPSRDSSAVLDAAWLANPPMMEAARAAGLRVIDDQNRMVTAEDHSRQLKLHRGGAARRRCRRVGRRMVGGQGRHTAGGRSTHR